MQLVKKSFIILVLAWLAILVFMPRQALYYTLEEKLASEEIQLNEESIKEGWFGLELKGVDVYVKGILLARIEKATFYTLLFYTKIDIQNLLLDDSMASMFPTKINNIQATHNIVWATDIGLSMAKEDTLAQGNIDLSTGSIRVDFNESKLLPGLKPQLKQDDKGWYYETSF